jgi:metallo-beta-lactamase class B
MKKVVKIIGWTLLVFSVLAGIVFASLWYLSKYKPEVLVRFVNVNWVKPFPAHHVIGNVYYVGGQDLAVYLLTTPQGHILVNSNFEFSIPQIQKSIEDLGFKFSDVKILLINHAHIDHCGGSAKIKDLSGAKYMVMDADVPQVEDGGRSDFHSGNNALSFPTTKVDRVLHDGDKVEFGGMTLTAHLTPGHSRGTTTWTFDVIDGGKTYTVVIAGSTNVNPGYKLVNNTKYPQIADDYKRSFAVLKSLPCDVYLGGHGFEYGMAGKYTRLKGGGNNPFIDPEGYKTYVAKKEQEFLTKLRIQLESKQD